MINDVKPFALEDFIKFFPEIDLPVVLTDESIHSFSKINKALPISAILNYLVDKDEDLDPFTEFVPCLSFEVANDITAIVVWKGTLLSYEYFLITINAHLKSMISKKNIGGTKVFDNIIIKSNAVISADKEIEVLVNQYESSNQIYPSKSNTYHFEIFQDGSIISDREHEQN